MLGISDLRDLVGSARVCLRPIRALLDDLSWENVLSAAINVPGGAELHGASELENALEGLDVENLDMLVPVVLVHRAFPPAVRVLVDLKTLGTDTDSCEPFSIPSATKVPTCDHEKARPDCLACFRKSWLRNAADRDLVALEEDRWSEDSDR